MKPVRLLHTSDIHLGDDGFVDIGLPGDRSERVLKALIDLSVQAGVDVVVVAGDLFDNNRVDGAVVELTIREFLRAAVPVVVLPGNHDCLVSGSVYKRAPFSQVAPNVHVFTALEGEQFRFPELDLAVWGKPINWYGGGLRPLEGIPPRGGERWQIAVAHGHYVGAEADQPYSFPVSDDEIRDSGRDYVALGHWDFFRCVCSDGVKAYYAGSAAASGAVAVVELSDDRGVQVRSQLLPL